MKNLILVALFALSLAACKKEDERACYLCTTTTTYSMGGASSNSTATLCDKTQDEIDDYQQSGTNITTASAGGITITIDKKTQCTRQ